MFATSEFFLCAIRVRARAGRACSWTSPGGSIGKVFPAVFAGHVVDVVEHELVVRAAESIREQAAELADLVCETPFRRQLGTLRDGRARHWSRPPVDAITQRL